MKKFILPLIIFVSLITPVNKANALDAKGRAFLVICTYGTVGGALLGFATMAFGTNSRAIAQGASLGLYAGIAFGSYIIASHKRPGEVEPVYDNAPPPPGFGTGGFGNSQMNNPMGGNPPDSGFGSPAPPPQDGGGFFGGGQRAFEISEDLVYNFKLKNKKGRDFSMPIYLNLVNMTF